MTSFFFNLFLFIVWSLICLNFIGKIDTVEYWVAYVGGFLLKTVGYIEGQIENS